MGYSTVWDDLFATDRDAFQNFWRPSSRRNTQLSRSVDPHRSLTLAFRARGYSDWYWADAADVISRRKIALDVQCAKAYLPMYFEEAYRNRGNQTFLADETQIASLRSCIPVRPRVNEGNWIGLARHRAGLFRGHWYCAGSRLTHPHTALWLSLMPIDAVATHRF